MRSLYVTLIAPVTSEIRQNSMSLWRRYDTPRDNGNLGNFERAFVGGQPFRL